MSSNLISTSALLSRRRFLQRSMIASAAVALPSILPSRLFGQTAPSNQINIGIIGTGNIAQGHIETLLGFNDVRIAAVCDVDRFRREAAADKINAYYGNKDCVVVSDFRELAARKGIDAVFVCTPDNWHAL